MNPRLFQFTFEDLTISKNEVVSMLHGGAVDESHEFYLNILSEQFEFLSGYNDIQGGFIESEDIFFEHKQKAIRVETHEFNVGPIIYTELKPSEKILVFTCTAGKRLSDYIKEVNRTDILKGFLIGSLANVIVETAMDRIWDTISREFATQSLMISNRFSPGYCSWDVAEQHKLFKLLPHAFCGVTLNDSALMQPLKSISGFIGVGQNITYNHYKCKFCNQKQCIYKKKP